EPAQAELVRVAYAHGEAGPEHALMDLHLHALIKRRPARLPAYPEFAVCAVQPQTPPGRARDNPAPSRGLPCLAHDFPFSGVKAEGLLSVGGWPAMCSRWPRPGTDVCCEGRDYAGFGGGALGGALRNRGQTPVSLFHSSSLSWVGRLLAGKRAAFPGCKLRQ